MMYRMPQVAASRDLYGFCVHMHVTVESAMTGRDALRASAWACNRCCNWSIARTFLAAIRHALLRTIAFLVRVMPDVMSDITRDTNERYGRARLGL